MVRKLNAYARQNRTKKALAELDNICRTLYTLDYIDDGVRWYLAYPLSYRNLEEMRAERGVDVDHSSVYRWVQKFTPQLEAVFRKGNKWPVGNRWRVDETYIKIKSQWKYLYRAVDRDGQTIDFLLTAHRDKRKPRSVFSRRRYGSTAFRIRSRSTRATRILRRLRP